MRLKRIHRRVFYTSMLHTHDKKPLRISNATKVSSSQNKRYRKRNVSQGKGLYLDTWHQPERSVLPKTSHLEPCQSDPLGSATVSSIQRYRVLVNSLDIQLAERQDFNKASKKIIAACLALNLYEKKNVSLYELCFDRPSLQPLPFPRGIANIHKIQSHKKSTSQFLKAPRACISYNKKLNELNNYNYVWIIYKSSPTTSSSEIRTCTWDVKIDKLIEWLIYSALIFRSVVDILSKLKIHITLTETSKKCTYSFVF